MVLRSGLRCAALFLLMMVPAMLRAATPPVPSSPPERVIDLANIIEPALEAQLVSALRELETKTTAQIVVLTVSSLDGETIEAVSLHTFGQWKLGQKGKDNGLLLTVALKERKYRFETGYGLESVLPDSLLGSIGREKLVPFFKEGKYGEGIAAATKEVLAVLAKNYQI
ncbi:TPM domain-containing protein [Candidatus Electronema sp. JM]|uniref:TPM domain-containing protein n=1 Tax=Candidatus Electronema sp. JM TaxID=3401571 RepID=UPI003AA852DA